MQFQNVYKVENIAKQLWTILPLFTPSKNTYGEIRQLAKSIT